MCTEKRRGAGTEKRRGAACCAPTLPYADPRVLRPAARPSAAVAVAPAPAPAPTAPGRRCRPPAAVASTWCTRSTPPATAAPATPPFGSRPRAFISPAAPLGCARRGRRAVGTVTAASHLSTIPRRECHPVTAATLHRIALAHRRV